MKRHYKVAGHVFSLSIDSRSGLWKELRQYSPFFVRRFPWERKPLFSLEVVDGLPDFKYEVLFDQPTEPGETKITLFTTPDGDFYCEMSPTADKPVSGRLLMSRDFSKGRLEVTVESERLFAVNNSLMLQYAFATAPHSTLEMHASVIRQDGKGYLFLAKSGTGKSTHSSMWLRAVPGSELLNDDNPIVRYENGQVNVYGSPWSGKTHCYRNESCPVGAFVKITRAPQNSISEMDTLEAYANIYSSSSGFKFDKAMSDSLHETFANVVTNSRCFEMKCLPDEDAATVCAKGVGANMNVSSLILPNEILLGEVKRILRSGSDVELRTKGLSMMPFIRGSIDSVRLVGYGENLKPRKGDIALAEVFKNFYVLHRIEELGNPVVLHGDGNLAGREFCTPGALIGKAVRIIRPDGTEVDCTGKFSVLLQRLWCSMPMPVRRLYLAVDRRIRKYIIKEHIS